MKKKNGCLGCFGTAVVVFIVLGIIGSALGGNEDNSTPATSANNQVAESQSDNNAQEPETPTTEAKKVVQEEPTEAKSDTECEYGDTTLKYVESKITKDDLDNDVLVLYFDFTNNSKDNKAYLYTYTTKVFQNGVELENNYFHVGQETRNADLEIQPGTTVRVASSYTFKGDRSTATVEVEPWISLGSDKLMNFTLEF